MALAGAAVVARLPHPRAASAGPAPAGTAPAPGLTKDSASAAGSANATGPAAASGDDHDALLRRLRELGALHQAGILTAEEFSTTKQAVLKRL